MKKFLVVLALMFAVSPTFAAIVTERVVAQKTVNEIGFNILNANNIDKRIVFKTTANIKNSRFVGFSHSWKPENANLEYNDRVIMTFGDALSLADSNDEIAAILSQAIAQGLESYKGSFRGWLSPLRYELNPRKYENRADLKAVDYMVGAGYNPVALIVMYNKTLGQTRYEWCHYYPLASKRMMNVYEHIYNNHPQYLKNNQYENNIYYVNFLKTSKEGFKKLEKKGRL